jgi:hypothetical protein
MNEHPGHLLSRATRAGVYGVLASFVVAVALVFGVSAASASSSVDAMLGATTVISGTSPAGIAVVLPQAATISGRPIGNQDVSVSGSGRFVGFVLRSADAASGDGTALIGGQLNGCYSSGCAPAAPVTVMLALGSLNNPQTADVTLPAGRYDLYLLTDGGPATVTLHFGGLSGAAYLAPSTPVSAKEFSPAAELPGIGAGPATYETGTQTSIGEPGGVLLLANAVSETAGAAVVGQCLSHSAPLAPGLYAFPGCPDDSDVIQETSNAGLSSLNTDLVSAYGAAPAEWTVGGYALGALAAYDFHLVGAAITYEPAALG